MYFTEQDIQQRRARLALKWDEVLKEDEAVLVYSGAPIQKPGGLDQHYPFLPHPSYYWLTGRRREDEVVLYNKQSGWVEFQKAFSKDQAVWEGEKQDLLVSVAGKDIAQLASYLEGQHWSAVYRLGQTAAYQKEGKAFSLNTLLDQTRRVKDEAEVRLIRHIAGIAAKGYEKIAGMMQAGISEQEIQIAYESEVYRNGGHKMPYDSIVGSGRNSAILHALPTPKLLQEGELVLIDAGADVFDYCVDITRTYYAGNSADSRRRDLYQLVLKVQEACVAMTRPGVFWRDVHAQAAVMFTDGLRQLGILKGNVDDLVAKEVIALFFPHGLGHLVGLRVRDTGQEENLDPRTYFGARLRVDIQLEPGHLITVEPGLYFIRALLEDPDHVKPFREDIDWQELEQWKDIGGVRIEDNILLTAGGNDNLTIAIPKMQG